MRFLKKVNLRRHFLTHTGQQQPFAYSVCVKGFTYRGKLKQHIKTHTAEKQQIIRESCESFSSITWFKKHAVCHSAKKISL